MYSTPGENFDVFSKRVNDKILDLTESTGGEYVGTEFRATFAEKKLANNTTQYGVTLESQGCHVCSISTQVPKGFTPMKTPNGDYLTIHSHGLDFTPNELDMAYDSKFQPNRVYRQGNRVRAEFSPQDQKHPGLLAVPNGPKWPEW